MPIWGLLCELRYSRPTIAFSAALLHDIHDSGLPGTLARACNLFGQMVNYHRDYYSRLDSEQVLSRVVEDSEFLTYSFAHMAPYPQAIQDYALATTWIALTALAPEIKDQILSFEFPGTAKERGFGADELKLIQKSYPTPLVFECEHLGLRLRQTVRQVNIPTADPSLRLLLERKLRVLAGAALSEDQDELREQVFTAIWEVRSSGQPVTLDTVAKYIGFRPETLTYALRSHGISFQKLKETIG